MSKVIYYFFGCITIVLGLFYSAEWYWPSLVAMYLIANFIFPKAINNNSIIVSLFSFILFIKFVITPLLFIISGDNVQGFIFKEVSIQAKNIAFIIMGLEIFSCLAIIQYFYIGSERDNSEIILKKQNNIFLIFMALFSGSLFFIFGELSTRYNFFIIHEELEKFSLEAVGSGLIGIMADMILVLPPLIFLSYFKVKFDLTGKKYYFLLSLLLIIPFILFFKGSSRFSVFIPAITWMIILSMLYPSYKKVIKYSIITILTIVITSITLYKQFGVTSGSVGQSLNLNIPELAVTLNAYFSGLYNVAYAIDMQNFLNNLSGFNLFINDLFKNLMYFSSFVDSKDTSSVIFNNYLYNNSGQADQIIPMSAQSYLYFGILGAPVLNVICTYLMILFNNKSKLESKLGYKYAYIFLSIYFSLSVILSINSIYPVVFNVIIPLLIILRVNSYNIRLAIK